MCYTKDMDICKDFQNKRICVAVSGGADSVALLHFLKTRASEGGYSLSAVHCEHGIRGSESIEDMHFVQDLCQSWGIPLFLFQEDCFSRAKREKSSLETAARHFRYACFEELFQEDEADYIATAHHQNDEAETVLFRLARGTALSGAAAMQEVSGRYIRPFLHRSKGEILEYVAKNALAYREDYTNFEGLATRNKLRLEVLPKLEEAMPEATKNIARFAQTAAEDDALLCELSEGLLTDGGEEIEVAFCDKKPLFTRACLKAMKALGVRQDYTASHLNALYALQASERGAWLTLPKNLRAEKREKGVVFFLPKAEKEVPLAEEFPFTEEGFEGGRYAVKCSTEPVEGVTLLYIDIDKVPKNAVFRFRREGDRIRTFSGITKSLKKLLNEKKIPTRIRGCLPLIAEKEGSEVYAVCGVEISERLKVDGGTTRARYLWIEERE